MNTISLVPLSLAHHVAALQAVYAATPSYWSLHRFSDAPAAQAEHDLRTAAETPGRTIVGIVQRLAPDDPRQGAELIGMIDLRLQWPDAVVVSVGLFMVAERYQCQGIGRQAWQLLEPWLATSAQMHKARLRVEQFNPKALKFFEQIGFQLTGEANRVRLGDKFVRLLTMEKVIQSF